MKIINTPNAPSAIGPYSQAVIANGFLYTSGQIALDPQTGAVVEGDITAQTKRVCLSIEALLSEAGTSFDSVVKTTCFLADMSDFASFNDVYGVYFTSKPARSCVAVKTLPKNVLCEVEVIAEIK